MVKNIPNKNSSSKNCSGGLFVPDGYTESEVIDIISVVARRLAAKFKFGYYDADDIVQEAVLIVMKKDCECLRKYDPKRPLLNFLSTHLRNRLYNFKRDNFFRPEPPCCNCPLDGKILPSLDTKGRCTEFESLSLCPLYIKWADANRNKRNIMNMIPVQNVCDEGEANMSYVTDFTDSIISGDVHDILMAGLGFKARKAYLIFIMGGFVGKSERVGFLDEMRQLIVENSISHDISGLL